MKKEKSLEDKIRNLLRKKEVSFKIVEELGDKKVEQWFIDTTEDEVLDVVKNFIIDEFSECTENNVCN